MGPRLQNILGAPRHNPIQVIYLNGPSSAGKTTLAHALQNALKPPFLHIGIDCIIGMMPAKFNDWSGGLAPFGYSWKSSVDHSGQPIQVLQVGSYAKRIGELYEKIVLTAAQLNHNIIIDDVADGKESIERWKELLKDYETLWVGLKPPLAWIEKQEQKRGDRMIGSARGWYHRTHEGILYDIELDPSTTSIDDMVEAISKRL